MAFVGIDNRRDLPKVSYSTALDYFVGVCFAFVLAAIIQFAGVHFFTKHGSGEVYIVPGESSDEEDDDEDGEEETEEDDHAKANFIRVSMSITCCYFAGKAIYAQATLPAHLHQQTPSTAQPPERVHQPGFQGRR